MKFFLALLAIVVCVSAEEEWTVKTPGEVHAIRAACLKEVPLTEEQLNHIKNFVYPNEDAVQKYVKCAYEKLGIFCPHSGYHADRITKLFKLNVADDDVKKIVDDCLSSHPKGDKSNEVHVYDIHKCVMNSAVFDEVKAYIKKHQH